MQHLLVDLLCFSQKVLHLFGATAKINIAYFCALRCVISHTSFHAYFSVFKKLDFPLLVDFCVKKAKFDGKTADSATLALRIETIAK